MSGSRHRVVQWATGNIGTRALREVIRHPGLELAGVLVYDPAKVGVDAGLLCGEEPVGVVASGDRDAMRRIDADCVLYMPRRFDLDDVTALLESGTNIVTTRGELFGGGHQLGGERRARVSEACDRGSSSIYATGSSPGFITDALPLALLSLQRRVDSVEIEEFANLSQRDSPNMLFEQMRFGQPVASFDPNRAEYLLREFVPPLGLLADGMERSVTEWSCTGEVAAARQTASLVAGEIPAGSVGAQRTTIVGERDGADVDLGWFTPAPTANRPVNAVPYVCAAAPGILSTTDLAPITMAGPRAGAGARR